MINGDSLDLPEVAAEVRAAFDQYEQALLDNDVEAMDRWFWSDERVVRYGLAEEQYGHAAVAAWRATADRVPDDRRVVRVTVQVFGPDLAAVDCEFRNGEEPATGRQSQTWIRLPEGWRIARAHVSLNPI